MQGNKNGVYLDAPPGWGKTSKLPALLQPEADGACWPPVGWHWAWHVVSATGFFVLINVLPPEDHESPGLDLVPCYSCFRFTPFGKKRNKVGAAVAV